MSDVAQTIAWILAVVVAAIIGYYVATLRNRVAVATLTAQRDMIAERLDDAEAGAEDSRDLAMTLAPLTSSVARLERQVGALQTGGASQWGALQEQLGQVAQVAHDLRDNTSALAGALRSTSARGAWGEVQLRRVMEHAGLLQRVDVDFQATARQADGTVVRPDAVVKLPGGKHIVIDAKAPMSAFLSACEAEDPGPLLNKHAAAVRHHVDALAKKAYWAAFEPSPELVVCFLPTEAFLSAACSHDPALLDDALSRRVVLATPTTLLAVLRTIAMTWQHDAVSKSAQEVLNTGRELQTRLAMLATNMDAVGKSLNRSVEDYNRLVGAAESRVFVTARKLATLGLSDVDVTEPRAVSATPRTLVAPDWSDTVAAATTASGAASDPSQ